MKTTLRAVILVACAAATAAAFRKQHDDFFERVARASTAGRGAPAVAGHGAPPPVATVAAR